MQLELNEAAGQSLKQAGLDTVASHNAQFVETLRAYAKDYCRRFGQVSSDDLRLYATAHGLYPTSSHAWGSILRGKGWTVIGRKPSKLETNHSREIRIYTFTLDTVEFEE